MFRDKLHVHQSDVRNPKYACLSCGFTVAARDALIYQQIELNTHLNKYHMKLPCSVRIGDY